MAKVCDLVDVRDEDALDYDAKGVAKLQSSDHAAVWFVRLLPGKAIEKHAHEDIEDNALVLSGKLSYHTGNADLIVPAGGWVVARPGELHGYKNAGATTLTMLLFQPMRLRKSAAHATQIPARMFRPGFATQRRTMVYDTSASMGTLFALTPGVNEKVDYARTHMIFVTEGRIMALLAGNKLSVDPGEGVFVRKSAVDLVGVSRTSVVAVFSTKP